MNTERPENSGDPEVPETSGQHAAQKPAAGDGTREARADSPAQKQRPGDPVPEPQAGDATLKPQGDDRARKPQPADPAKAQADSPAQKQRPGDLASERQAGDATPKPRGDGGTPKPRAGDRAQAAQTGDPARKSQAGDLAQGAQADDSAPEQQVGDLVQEARADDPARAPQGDDRARKSQAGDSTRKPQDDDQALKPHAGDPGQEAHAGDPAPEVRLGGGREPGGDGGPEQQVGDVVTGGGGSGERSGRRRSPLVVVSVSAAVLLVGGGGAYLAAGGGSEGRTSPGASGGGGTPPPLALDGWTGTNGIAPGEHDPYGVTYVAPGELPDGPGSAPVYTPKGEVGRDAVVRLAKALGIGGTPVAEGRVWRIGGKDGSGPSLHVNRDAPGSWTYSRYAPGTDDCKKGVLCVHDPMVPAGTPVSVRKATEVAAPVLKAAGLDDAKIDAGQILGAQRVVNADPVVDGLPTYGWATGLTVGKKGELVSGHGLLSTPVKGDTYPVLGAGKTLELLNGSAKSGHRMGIGGCATPVPAKDRLEQPCGASTGAPERAADTVTVEKAVFGLAAHAVRGRQTLVPSWLFEVREPAAPGESTVTYPAVDPAYLVATRSAPSTGPSAAPRTRHVKVNGYTADGRQLTVSFSGGVCADYTASARESDGRVTVTVTEKPWPDKVCVLIAKEYVKTVRLDAPLDGRTVVGADGERIAEAEPGALRPQAR